MIFASDNWPGAHPKIAERLFSAASDHTPPYGTGAIDKRVEERLSALFEREVSVFFVATGTAANSLALASCSKPGSVIFCHEDAHIIHHEGGAVEFQSGGAKLVPVGSSTHSGYGRMDPSALLKAIARFPSDDVHVGQKCAVSISQVTEAGTTYSLDDISAISEIAHGHGMKVHMDGARFSNAVVAMDVTPAEMTWKSGVDILSLGGTKNGCWCAEAIVFFHPEDGKQMPRLRKRAANLFSKSNFIAVQFDAWLENDLWRDLASHANKMAEKLKQALEGSNDIRFAWHSNTSQLFPIIRDERADALRQAGVRFYDWDTPDEFASLVGGNEQIRRFITSYATKESDIDQIAALLK